jgi:hypothetical protein
VLIVSTDADKICGYSFKLDTENALANNMPARGHRTHPGGQQKQQGYTYSSPPVKSSLAPLIQGLGESKRGGGNFIRPFHPAIYR